MIAERAGRAEQASRFRAAIDEEKAAAEAIAALIEPVTATYLDLTLSGAKAFS